MLPSKVAMNELIQWMDGLDKALDHLEARGYSASKHVQNDLHAYRVRTRIVF